ncbi:MAG: hypothetical protein MUF43_05270 [Flavobacterium sp.]|nr:hypothetical protein [Flavobacterium sp.]
MMTSFLLISCIGNDEQTESSKQDASIVLNAFVDLSQMNQSIINKLEKVETKTDNDQFIIQKLKQKHIELKDTMTNLAKRNFIILSRKRKNNENNILTTETILNKYQKMLVLVEVIRLNTNNKELQTFAKDSKEKINEMKSEFKLFINF